ncbi:dihydrofolate reductase [Weissella diestrammenae]|uniref:Dihydrofolate reductase n=1 Tax=Weissella diestrammenae TaxID=1162633 RepID=A0A7G9T5R5_9LACO|nr:dihydrofolate reductase [Weissella diestrammenae]MCM0582268.1 dihydrofolate reductase [Weissella diestrammenae]QNN75440.1 dihydrofolate reductase [Weissella diestrammenae]
MVDTILVWAQTENGTIAMNGEIPWREKADMRFFREITQNQVVVMGRHTMQSFHGRPLPHRTNLVLSHDKSLVVPEGFQVVHSIDEAKTIASQQNQKLMVIGGKAIYESFMPDATQLYVTYLNTDFTGDVMMAPVDKTIWQGESIRLGHADDENDFDYEIIKYSRRK